MQTANIFEGLPGDAHGEVFERIITAGDLRIERIVSRGQPSPETGWYDQEQAEWVMVVKGAARLTFADGTVVEMGPGDHVTIAPHERHRVAWTDPETVWVAVHYSEASE